MEHIRAIRDGMAETFAKTRAADVTVLSSPVRFYSISTQMKTPTGRCLVNHRRPAGEKLYYIITAANPRREAADETIAAFRGFLRCLPDAEEAGILHGAGETSVSIPPSSGPIKWKERFQKWNESKRTSVLAQCACP